MSTSARQLGLTVTKMSGEDELVLCPFHNDSNSSAWYSPKKELFWCSVCNQGYNLYQLCTLLGVEVDLMDTEDEPNPVYNLIDAEGYRPVGVALYHDYFEKRNIDSMVIRYYGVRWDATNNAAVLPITNAQGKEVGCALRYQSQDDFGTRYRFLGETRPVWPMHRLTVPKKTDTLIITEGAWSAMRIETAIINNAGTRIDYLDKQLPPFCYALLGAKANGDIAQALSGHKGHIFILYDDDVAGRRACKKMRRLLPSANCYTLAKSPDDMDDEEVMELLRLLVRKFEVTRKKD